jgi:hypothetical protein
VVAEQRHGNDGLLRARGSAAARGARRLFAAADVGVVVALVYAAAEAVADARSRRSRREAWDETLPVSSLRYDYVHGQQNESRVAMLIAAPALNPGWYMYRFISGCGGLANQ